MKPELSLSPPRQRNLTIFCTLLQQRLLFETRFTSHNFSLHFFSHAISPLYPLSCHQNLQFLKVEYSVSPLRRRSLTILYSLRNNFSFLALALRRSSFHFTSSLYIVPFSTPPYTTHARRRIVTSSRNLSQSVFRPCINLHNHIQELITGTIVELSSTFHAANW